MRFLVAKRDLFFWFGEVLVGFEFLGGGGLGGHAIGGNVGAGDPDQGVEDDFAEIVVGPVIVPMAAGESETSSAVGPFIDPGDVFGHAQAGADILIAAVGSVFASSGFVGRYGGKDGSNVVHIFDEAHMIVPLVFDLEGFDAAGHGVLG